MTEISRRKESLLTQEHLKEILHYDPETGIWKSIAKRGRNGVVGKIYRPRPSGYVVICIDGESYYGHRLAFLYMTGKWPSDQVDHSFRKKIDNRWVALRQATHSQNQANRVLVKNASGYLGVYRHPKGKGWSATISAGKRGQSRYLGYFDRIENAALAYNLAAHEMFGEFATFNRCING